MSLKEALFKNKPREIAGAISSSRFDYQKDWSICTLLECHKKGSDYLVLFDYHEDLIIMDLENDPQKVSFYQLKGRKSGSWTIDRLVKSEKDKDGNPLLSIIGRLYDCKQKFKIETESLNFVSNASFKIKLDHGQNCESKTEICILEITAKDKEKIKNKLIEELSPEEEPDLNEITFLKVTELSLDDSASHAKGKLSDFLEEIKPNGKFAIPALYQNLFGEVKRRTAFNKEVHSFEELLEKKGIGKSLLDGWLNKVGIFRDYDDLWNRIENGLTADGLPVMELKRIRSSWTDYEIAIKDPNNEILFKIIEQIKQIFTRLDADNKLDDLLIKECMNRVYEHYSSSPIPQPIYKEPFLKAVILSEIYG